MGKVITTIILMVICMHAANSQQVADTDFHPAIADPAYAKGKGPVIFIDEGHNNFHTKNGRYLPFANLLEQDGYQVEAYAGSFAPEKLLKGSVLVISNALNEINVENWYLPTPSAFTKEEIEFVERWVQDGGSLFLIADHMPMAGAATDMAMKFGFEFTNGFVKHDSTEGTAFFVSTDGSLGDNVITNGRNNGEKVTSIVSFTGQAFRIPHGAVSILTFDDHYTNLMPDTAWVFTDRTRRAAVKGWSQGAFLNYGKGRVVVFGEAAMFSAQLAGKKKRKVGMNDPKAPQNYQLLLNIIHWLDHKL